MTTKPVFHAVNEFVGSKEEESTIERSISSRANVRNVVASDVEEYLKTGGKVEEVPRGMRADPPKKPVSNYGSRPI